MIDFTSVRQSSRPSAIGTSSSYNAVRGGTNNRGDDNAGNDRGDDGQQQQQSQYHWAYSLVKMIPHTTHIMKMMTLEESV